MKRDNLDREHYQTPLSTRYASPEMTSLFSERFRALTYRKLWIELAKGQKELGLSISDRQIEEMIQNAQMIDFSSIQTYEKKFRHDVMAHIHAFGDLCPNAKGIIHLGATSCFVTDNTDLIQIKTGMEIILGKILHVLRILSSFVKKHAYLACVGYTHLQPAQPTTYGKRSSLWLQDFLFDFLGIEKMIKELPFLGAKGATGSQSSFLALFNNQEMKVTDLDKFLAKRFGFSKLLTISGQTYPRKIDIGTSNLLASFAASAHKMGSDLRLLSSMGELSEGFNNESQIGSSAMPYKQNPILSERICSLSRYLIALSQNAAYTAANQWLERTLDDSANRRLSIPESFLCADAILNLLITVIDHLSLDETTINLNLKRELPFLAMENILMAATKKGENRQDAHEALRKYALELLKGEGEDLVSCLQKNPACRLSSDEIQDLLKAENLIGLAPKQVDQFLNEEIRPILERYSHLSPNLSQVNC